MLDEFLPFAIPWNGLLVSGACLWGLALYVIYFSVAEWMMVRLQTWFDFVEQHFLYPDPDERERTRLAREGQNAFNASLLSIIPFLGAGTVCSWLMGASLGSSWSISLGIMACVGGGIFQLGRRSN